MAYGRVTPEGFLPVFSVGTEEEAERLITGACPTDLEGNHFARELAQEQTLPRLYAFSDRLAEVHERFVERGTCTCKKETRRGDKAVKRGRSTRS